MKYYTSSGITPESLLPVTKYKPYPSVQEYITNHPAPDRMIEHFQLRFKKKCCLKWLEPIFKAYSSGKMPHSNAMWVTAEDGKLEGRTGCSQCKASWLLFRHSGLFVARCFNLNQVWFVNLDPFELIRDFIDEGEGERMKFENERVWECTCSNQIHTSPV